MSTVLHLPVTYLPWTIGGKEVYCHRLGKELRRRGMSSNVVVHSDSFNNSNPGRYEHEGVPVYVLSPIEASNRREAAYSCSPDSIPGFSSLLRETRPRIVHFHDFSMDAGLLHLKEARKAGARIVMAYQSAGQACLQRSLWQDGDPKMVCDGRLDQDRCTRCRLTARGLPRVLSPLVAKLSFLPVDAESKSALSRMLSAPDMTARFIRAWQECVSLVDIFHTGAAWAVDLLKANGVPAEKTRHISHGVAEKPAGIVSSARRRDGALRVGIVGRSDPAKGHHILVDAVRRLPPEAPIHVVLVGAILESEYGRALQARIGSDRRFQVRPPVNPEALPIVMREFDVLAVPSLWMETGPQVVIDAFSVGVPVVGSRLGGIAELVRDGVDGVLFRAGDSRELSEVLEQLLGDRSKLDAMKTSIRPVLGIGEVADEITALYDDLVGGKRSV